MSRIAVLADVHGNLPALEAALADVEREGFDVVVSGGDLVSGPMPAECLERFASLDLPVRWVMGNADRLARDPSCGDAHAADRFAHERLSAEQRDRIATFEPVVTIGDVLVCHGTPASDEEVITVVTPPDRLTEVLRGLDARLVIGGHVHHQFTQSLRYVTWVNAGSVGMPYEGRPGAFWLEIADGTPLLRCSNYDVDAAAAAIEATGYPDADGLAEIIRGRYSAQEAALALEPAG
ncbi:MAG: metallophosphoesterase [Solirubrobacterales bacterium]|nr:metallophosphoesterase [Solirubrobacterales bacterium]